MKTKTNHNLYTFARTGMLFLMCLLSGLVNAQVIIDYDVSDKPVAFGVRHIEEALLSSGIHVNKMDGKEGAGHRDIAISIKPAAELPFVRKEGFDIRYRNKVLMVSAIDNAGAMYGALDVAEQISMGRSWKNINPKTINPHFTVRAVKFNLPWSSYREGSAMDQNMETCRDLEFWRKFIEQMAENHFNVLSLWNVHPFSYMVKPLNFPGANDFSPAEMAQWKEFFTSLFRICREHAVEPFIVNWNIAVSPEFARNYHVHERNDTSEIVKRYTREVVTQVINEYPDLAGIGITLADWMSNNRKEGSSLPVMTPKDREDWIEQTVIAGIKTADRPVKLLHRSVLTFISCGNAKGH